MANAVRLRSLTSLAVLPVLLLAMPGCSSTTAITGDTSDIAIRPSTGVAAGDSALLEGVLVHEGGCTVIRADHGDFVPVFAEGDAAWDDDTFTFRSATGTIDTAVAGDTVRLGGGEWSGAITSDMSVPGRCLQFALWNVAEG